MRSPSEGRAPNADDVRAAVGRRIPDLVVPGLTVLSCGINPGLYSATAKHHFARPGVLASGQKIRVFTLVDVHTRECLTLRVQRSFRGEDVASILSEVGKPVPQYRT